MMKSFRKWVKINSSEKIQEMAILNFGKFDGKDHTQVPLPYLQWMKDQIVSGKPVRFNLSDKGTAISDPKQVSRIIDQELQRRKIKQSPANPTSQANPFNSAKPVNQTSSASIVQPKENPMQTVPR